MIEIFKVDDCFAYNACGYTMIYNDKNLKGLKELAKIIFGEVEEAKKAYRMERKILFPSDIFIEHKYPKKPRLFSSLTRQEINKFWDYYKKLAEST